MTTPDEPRADRPLRDAWHSAAAETPPPALDAAVLAQSRAALAPASRWATRWPAVVATAAVVVLGVQVLLRLPGGPAATGNADLAEPVVSPAPEVARDAVARGPVDTASDRAWRAPQMPPAPAASAERYERAAADTASDAGSPLAAPFPASAPPAAATAAPPALFEQARGPAAEALRAAPAANDYDLRLDAIRAVLASGDTATARTLLARLREAYPDRAVPDDLATALPPP